MLVPVAEERRGLLDLWQIWDVNATAIFDSVHALLSSHVVLGPLVRGIPLEQMRARGGDLVEGLRAATQSDGQNAVDALFTEWAAGLVSSGLGVDAWLDAAAIVRRQILPALFGAHVSEPERLQSVLHAVQWMGDRALAALTQQHMSANERLLVAQRKQTEQARLRFDRLAEAGVLGVIVCDLLGNIREANDGFLAMIGYSREELLSGSVRWGDMTPPEWRHLDEDAIEQLKVSGKTRPWEKEYIRKDGSRMPILVGVAMLDESECVAFILDITERKRLEELRARSTELENQNRRIQETNRLKSEFLANMSHELRTPLNCIIGFADVLHDGEVSPESPEHRELLGEILGSGRHLLSLLNDVLDLAKVESGTLDFFPEELELSRVVAEVCGVVRAIATSKSIRLETDIDPAVNEVSLDPSRLKQVLYNYLSNALKFTPEGGTIDIRARPEQPDTFRLEVIDSGIGIAPADLSRLFVEFQQLDSGAAKKHAGTGLGLALTKRIVEAQGGAVGVKSTVGSGSVFFAVLPRRGAPGPGDTRPPPLAPEQDGNGPTLLVVDDDVRDQTVLARVLRRHGYKVEVVATGLEAVGECRDRKFGAVTLDLLLPDITGLEVLRRLRGEGMNRDTPVIIVSVVAERGVVGGFQVHDYLQKPVDGAALVESLRRAGLAPDLPGPILVVDDDGNAVRLMETMLRRFGYRTEGRLDGMSALAMAEREPPLAVIVDLLMPGMDGFEFLKRFRRLAGCQFSPAIVWTMKDLTADDNARLHRLAQAVVAKGEPPSGELVDQLGALLSRRPRQLGAS